ncbi:hypothetical protein [Desertibaculum subflavum]|uniref:hypothetical protein n=1 Tax=Desertibaculum subflavum TaxID=2268458 RepID=UPI000E660DC0
MQNIDEEKIAGHARWVIEFREGNDVDVHHDAALRWNAEHAALQTAYLRRVSTTLIDIRWLLYVLVVLAAGILASVQRWI